MKNATDKDTWWYGIAGQSESVRFGDGDHHYAKIKCFAIAGDCKLCLLFWFGDCCCQERRTVVHGSEEKV